GSSLLLVLGLGLLVSGLFALLLAATGRFLPHDERFLGMNAGQLCALHGCRVVHFMVHDRLAFGGALAALGGLYPWLVAAPLPPGVGLVGPARERGGRLPQLPGLPRLRLPRHLARSRHPRAVAVFRPRPGPVAADALRCRRYPLAAGARRAGAVALGTRRRPGLPPD